MSKAREIFIFGGTFDPVHHGHLGVIKEIVPQSDMLILAPTSQNPFKEDTGTSFEHRVRMLELFLEYEKLPYSKDISSASILLSEFPYEYAKDLVGWIRENIEGELTWVVGPDIADEVTTWKDWNLINVGIYVAKNYANNLHSSDIREATREMHPALVPYVEQHALYKNKL